jgi:NAD(P)-dependent dehydrogenase (short-subunit alcohol dehydrogenase family)
MTKKVWFVTGASQGLGLALVKKLIAAGHNVAATSRNVQQLTKAVAAPPDQFLALGMDLGNEQNVAQAIKQTVDRFGKIDVVVNNAGYGLIGGLEELSDAEARANFETNVFGALNVIRQVLPQLRKQQSGHIFNIASIGGFVGGFPGFGIYCATKFAMHGFSEALAVEAKPFGINVTVVSPGYFRTNFLESSSLRVPAKPMEEYKLVRESQIAHQNNINGNQLGDPDKAADVMMAVAQRKDAPVHLFLGADAYDMAAQQIDMLQKELADLKSLATATAIN